MRNALCSVVWLGVVACGGRVPVYEDGDDGWHTRLFGSWQSEPSSPGSCLSESFLSNPRLTPHAVMRTPTHICPLYVSYICPSHIPVEF